MSDSPPKREYNPHVDRSGTHMDGVKHFPFSHNEKLYYGVSAACVASRITHPYLKTCVKSGSLPFNVLSNSAADQGTTGWGTTHQLSYTKKTPDRSSGAGVRTEQY